VSAAGHECVGRARPPAEVYGETVAIDDLSLTVAAGEFFTLLGSSGSGKTTTLMMIAGFVEPDAGEILIGGRSIVDLPPERRDVGVVFQSYALFPNMNVVENVAFPLRMRHVDRATRLQGRADAGARQSPPARRPAGRRPQRRRAAAVALARALVFEPPLLLMDEPLGALDRKLREQLQIEIKRIQSKLGVTVIYVTHDQEEALVLSDRIGVMAEGEIRQMGPIAEVYERPDSLFVAQFLGESNVLSGRMAAGSVRHGAGRARRRRNANQRAGAPHAGTGDVKIMVRPESIALTRGPASLLNSLPDRWRVSSFSALRSGTAWTTAAGTISVRVPERPRPACGCRRSRGRCVAACRHDRVFHLELEHPQVCRSAGAQTTKEQ
jgi:ABC-type Fe3+/spermidine/putrescine transport system ATPase subunit